MSKSFSAIFPVLCILASCASESNPLKARLQDYVDSCNAEIGVAVIANNKDTVEINPGLYPLNSVMKMLQALPAARYLSEHNIRLDSVVAINRSELQHDTWSPMLTHFSDSVIHISYGELLEYSLQQSDNNACDILLELTAGIDDTNKFWRDKGINDISIKWNEAEMHEDPLRSNDNYASPMAAAAAINYLLPYCLSSSDFATSQVGGMLMNCSTGTDRIPAPLANSDALVAHKTGTGFEDAEGHPTGVNDVAFVILPDGISYSLAVFVKSAPTDLKGSEAMIADISEIVLEEMKAAKSSN